MIIVYQKALIRTLQYNFCGFTTQEHKLKRGFCTPKPAFKVQKKILLRFGMTKSINKYLRLKIPYTNDTNY